ncbi:acyl-lipid (9-3)-desaturase [Cryptomeria japonica]|uniref:acyl-lipid (9-3)-desaturase n=1 Tax=Cryptomeria japonica TaxID=3369 RepID=UPI0027DA1939|nr:acyl-lipid (9-3)-desaturase [Cryptomeria japonica]
MTDSSSEKLHAKWPKISTQELRTHNNVDDLWLSIQGKVYDVTKWVNTHPGGDLPLLNLAGQDVTDAFIAYHPGSAWKYLDQFMIGVHEDYEVSEISKDYRRLLGDLKKAGLFKRPKYVYGLIGLLMVAMLVMSVVGVLFYEGFWTHVACGVLMGAVWTQSGWIGHDSGHCGLVGNKRIDRIIQLVAGNGLTGISIAWWKRNHNAHHIACNSLEFDPDLQYIPLFAVSSRFFCSLYSYFYDRKMSFDGVARVLVCYQHWTFYPVMAIARINLFGQSIVLLLSKKKIPDRAKEIVGLVAFWIWFPLLISCMPTWSERSAFVLSSFMVTGVQHVQFCLNHFSSSVYVGRPCSKNWFESQTKGTLDISCSPWLDWFHGGLQHQVEHHLFPRLPRHNLRKIAPFVKPLCLKYQLPYTMVTFWEANLMTIRTLRAAALEAQDMSKPVPKNLLWEALNTHG